jgi:hypothetical protein
MPKVEIQKHTLNLRAGDYARISEIFAPDNISAANVIRRVIARYVDSFNTNPAPEDIASIKGNIE